jgi:hypothetical protein
MQRATMPDRYERTIPMPVTFTILDSKIQDMASTMEVAGVFTNGDMVNNALALFKWAVKHAQSGRVIAAFDADGQRYEIQMAALYHAALDGHTARLPDQPFPAIPLPVLGGPPRSLNL